MTRSLERILAMTRLSADEERTWSMGPIGDRAGIYAVWDEGVPVYHDEADNELEPGWVLRVLRGVDAIPPDPEAGARHPWMAARAVMMAPAVWPKPCKRCGRGTFRAEQVSARTEPLRCEGCQLVAGRCRCKP